MATAKAQIILTAVTAQLNTGLNSAKQKLQSFDDGVGKLSGSFSALQGAAVVGAVAAVGKFAIDAALAADRVDQLNRTVENLSGGSAAAAENMDALNRATMGLSSEGERLEIAQQFLGMQLANNAQDLERVITASTRLGATFRGLGAREAADEFALMVANMFHTTSPTSLSGVQTSSHFLHTKCVARLALVCCGVVKSS